MAWPWKVLNALNSYWTSARVEGTHDISLQVLCLKWQQKLLLAFRQGWTKLYRKKMEQLLLEDISNLFSFPSLKWTAFKRKAAFYKGQIPPFCHFCFPLIFFLYLSLSSSLFSGQYEEASLKLICPLYLPPYIPFISKLSGRTVCHHCLEFLQLFWISSSWLSFLCFIRTALITKSCLLAKSQSQSFFSSSSTLQFFCDQNTFLLSASLCLCLPHYLFCLHCYSLHCHPFGVCSPSLSPYSVHRTSSYDPLFKQSTFKKNVGQKYLLLLFACTVCAHIIWLIRANLMAHKVQS